MGIDENIELRSKKVRNIIGQVPKKIIRIGISSIFFIFLVLMMFAYFFQFEYTVEGVCTLNQKNDTIYYSLEVTSYDANRIKPNQKILLRTVNIPTIDNIETNVQQIDSNLYITDSASYIKIKGSFLYSKVILTESIKVEASVKTGKINILDLILK